MARTASVVVAAAIVLTVALVHGSQGASFTSSTPKAEKIAFVRLRAVCKPSERTCADLYLMSSDGTHERRLVRRVPDSRDFSWSPDGQKIVFGGLAGISVINSDGTGSHTLTHNPADGDPVWSPDGHRIAFASSAGPLGAEDVYVMNADGSQRRLLARRIALPSEAQKTFAWSPDGRRIAYIVQVGLDETGNDARFSRIYLIGSGGGRSRLLERREYSITIDGVDWSPDGRTIAYVDRSELRSESEICIKSVRGGRARCPRSMSADNEDVIHDPAWSPDGHRIAFDGVNVASPDGKPVWRTRGGEDPSWSPDGRKIAFWFNGINVVNADGAGLRRLTRNDGFMNADRYPLWQPQSTRKR